MTMTTNDHNSLALQVAELDAAYTDYTRRIEITEDGLGETARDLEFLESYTGSIHYGLVEMYCVSLLMLVYSL